MNESALKLSLTGWVRNASDGSVEAFIQGPQDNVNDMLSSLWEGPNLADVEDVLTQDSQVDESLELFEIH
jgi:acylphosphatase